MVVHVLTARLDARVPTDGEARLAAAVFAVRDGRVGPVALPFPDAVAARQLAAVAALLPTAPSAWAPSVWDGVRAAGLALGVVTALLLWALLRRLGCGSLPTALAVAVVGVTAPALFLHASATGAAIAVPWLLLAALLSWRVRVPGIAVAVAAAVAVLTAPLLGAVLLALAAHAVAERVASRTLRATRGLPLAAALAVAAAGVSVAAAGSGPLAGAAPVIATLPALAGAACGLVAVVVGWRVRWVRPLLTPAVLLLAVLLVPGSGRAAAALAALALLAVVAAGVADDAPARLGARVPARAMPALWAAGAVALVVLAVAALPAGRPRTAAEPAPAVLVAWAGEQEDPRALLHADALDRAELVAAGFPAERLRGLDEPVSDVDVVLLTARAQAAAPAHCAPGTLLETLPGWSGAPAEVCGARPAEVADDPAERASRARIGAALAGNPELRLDPAAAELLRRGDVDPRLMIVLVALTGSHTVEVADFPAAALAPPTTLRRQVLVRAVDGAAATADAPSPVRAWLDGQLPPYAPTLLRDDDGCLLVGYRDAAPPGLLPA